MKLLLYSNGPPEATERLTATTRSAASAAEVDICNTIAELLNRLKRSRCDLSVVILCASTQENLVELLGCRQWLSDLRTILILPDRDSSTIAQGLTLCPRFISFVDTDFADVSTVLSKMLRIYGRESIAF